MKTYKLTFKLTKHKDARPFVAQITADDDADVQGIKEAQAMYYEQLYGTPVKCTKVVEGWHMN